MHVILTSKPGQYRTELNEDIELIETWHYHFYGRLRARFDIGRLRKETRVRIVAEDDTGTVNIVPSKFLERFDDYASAKRELEQLCSHGGAEAQLLLVTASDHTSSTGAHL